MDFLFKVLYNDIREIRDLRVTIRRVEKERNEAEYDKEYYAKELEEERALRSHLEDVNEYYRTQIRKNCIFDGERNRDFGRKKSRRLESNF